MPENAIQVIEAEIGELTRKRDEALREADKATARAESLSTQLQVLAKIHSKLASPNGNQNNVEERTGTLTLREHFEPIGPTRAILAFLTSHPGSTRVEVLDAVCSLPNLQVNSERPRNVVDSCLRQLENRERVISDARGKLSVSHFERG